MTSDPFYKDHWQNIDTERLVRYQKMFQWNPASSALYEPADIGTGHITADFGCGPGHTAVEMARWVGAGGHVHALDINAEFITQTRKNAKSAGFDDRITAHLCDGTALPLPDGALDRLSTRNTLIYVDDPEQTIREFHRTLKPGGKVHAIEGDWPMMIVEPVPAGDWFSLVEASGHACRTPDIGRKLHGLMARCGFSETGVQVITRPDTEGRLLPMIRNMSGYAQASGKLNDKKIQEIMDCIEQAVVAGTYMALAPQFVVTATA